MTSTHPQLAVRWTSVRRAGSAVARSWHWRHDHSVRCSESWGPPVTSTVPPRPGQRRAGQRGLLSQHSNMVTLGKTEGPCMCRRADMMTRHDGSSWWLLLTVRRVWLTAMQTRGRENDVHEILSTTDDATSEIAKPRRRQHPAMHDAVAK